MEDNIKTYCVSCNKPIPGTIDWYIERGNYCKECIADANFKVKGKFNKTKIAGKPLAVKF